MFESLSMNAISPKYIDSSGNLKHTKFYLFISSILNDIFREINCFFFFYKNFIIIKF